MRYSQFLLVVILALLLCTFSCSKKTDPAPFTPGPPVILDTTYHPIDPVIAPSIGFYLDDWTPKSFIAPQSISGTIPITRPLDTINIDLNKVLTKVPAYIFGNNANQWMGQIVDQPALMGYINDLHPTVIRFPGGSISDVYFWNAPVNTPPTDVASTFYDYNLNPISVSNGDYWYGSNSANWTITLDHYYQLLQQTGTTGMITVNYAYARYGKGPTPVQTAAHLAADWVRYDKGKTKFWEVGNESGGAWEAGYKINLADNQDGQPEIITGALYGEHFKVFADSMRKAAVDIGAIIKIGAQVVGAANTGIADKSWNSDLFNSIGNEADFFIVHNYYGPFQQNSTASTILQSAVSETNDISTYLRLSTSQKSVQMKPISLTEWNINSEGSKQKVSAVAGMHAVLTLGEILNNNFGQASRWDLANSWANGNDHGLFNNSISGDSEPGASVWNPRPAFFYLYYFQKYFGDRMVSSSVLPSTSDLKAYASSFTSGEAGTIIVNTGNATLTTLININHFKPGTKYYWFELIPGTDNGDFSGRVLINNINPTGTTGGPLNYASIQAFSASISSGSFSITVHPRAVLFIVADHQ